jgi:hypothetical protein
VRILRNLAMAALLVAAIIAGVFWKLVRGT